MDKFPVFAPLQNAIKKAAQPFDRINKMAVHYPHLLQLQPLVIKQPAKVVFFTQEGRKELCDAIEHNLTNISLPKTSWRKFFSHTIGLGHIANFGVPLVKGLLFSGLFRLGAFLCLPFSIGRKTMRAHHDGGLQSAIKTFAIESVKAIISWEAGTIGALFGAMVCPVASIIPFAGIIGMSLASTAVHHALNKII